MRDKITLERIALMHPLVRYNAGMAYDEICEVLTGKAICRFARTLSTFAEQDEIYAQGRTKPGPIVTNARGGESYHNYALALDVVLLLDKDNNGTYETPSWDFAKDFDGDMIPEWQEIDRIMKKYGFEGLYNKRGTRWDLPHFQNTLGYSIKQLQEIHRKHIANKQTGYLPL